VAVFIISKEWYHATGSSVARCCLVVKQWLGIQVGDIVVSMFHVKESVMLNSDKLIYDIEEREDGTIVLNDTSDAL